jgi:putative endonuclease
VRPPRRHEPRRRTARPDVSRAHASRLAAWRRGRFAESVCVWLLRARFYRILARGYRVPAGEIDILARRGGTVVAIEVKARAGLADAAEAVSPRQRRRVARAFEQFLASRPDLAPLQPRFDVILVTPGRWPRHIVDAWRVDD